MGIFCLLHQDIISTRIGLCHFHHCVLSNQTGTSSRIICLTNILNEHSRIISCKPFYKNIISSPRKFHPHQQPLDYLFPKGSTHLALCSRCFPGLQCRAPSTDSASFNHQGRAQDSTSFPHLTLWEMLLSPYL